MYGSYFSHFNHFQHQTRVDAKGVEIPDQTPRMARVRVEGPQFLPAVEGGHPAFERFVERKIVPEPGHVIGPVCNAP